MSDSDPLQAKETFVYLQFAEASTKIQFNGCRIQSLTASQTRRTENNAVFYLLAEGGAHLQPLEPTYLEKQQAVQQQQMMIASYVGRILRETFGKGPESVYVSMGQTFISIYLRNFLSPSEKILMEQNDEMMVHQLRDKLMETILPDVNAYIGVTTGIKLREIYYDWSLHNRNGLLFGIAPEPFTGTPPLFEPYKGKEAVEYEIMKISQQAQKAPEELYSAELNPRTLVVIRNGILIRIEKELCRLGHKDLLRRIKRHLEKSYLHNSSIFESALSKQVIDSFVDWDFELDKSIMVFILNPKQPRGGNVLDMNDMSQT